jgi:2-oxoglutarate ferredoxin oxidoreductase subunit alpha
MTPVVMLSDGYLAQGSAPWRVPEQRELPEIKVQFATDPKTFQPYARLENGSRPWAIPPQAGLRHRIGGLEKEHITGNVCYVPENHQRMRRAPKVANVIREVPDGIFNTAVAGGLGGTFSHDRHRRPATSARDVATHVRR